MLREHIFLRLTLHWEKSHVPLYVLGAIVQHSMNLESENWRDKDEVNTLSYIK